jgi:hypothetical protein
VFPSGQRTMAAPVRAPAGCVRPEEPHDSRMTPLREAVLRTMQQAAKPLGAYDLIERLGTVLGRRLTPTTVYRTLD